MAGKNPDNQGTAKESDLARLISEVMAECSGQVGFTTSELAAKIERSEASARRLIRTEIASGNLALGDPKIITTISGVRKPSPTYIWVGE